MKKIFLFICLSLAYLCVEAQEHIRFNGATLGQSLENVTSSLKVFSGKRLGVSGRDNCWKYTGGIFGAYKCEYYISCDLNNEIVFEVAACIPVNNVDREIKPNIDLLQSKYEEYTEKENEHDGTGGHIATSYVTTHEHTYAIRRKSDNKLIGKVTIAGFSLPAEVILCEELVRFIKITYYDYAAAKAAKKGYNNIMNELL